MSTGLYSGVSGLALGTGLYKGTLGLWGGASGLINQFGATLNLDFLAGAPLDSRITFSRTTNATLVDATGRVTYAPNNLVTYSEQFDNAAWTKTASTITPNATAAPNGTTTADKLVENTAVTTGHFVAPNPNPSPTAIGQTYILSVYAKAAERTFIQLMATGISPGSGNFVAGFDLTNGTAGPPNVAQVTSAITSVGGGWYRCSITFSIYSVVAMGLQVRLSLNSTNAPSSYTGDGTSGLFIWGAQFEQVTYQTLPSTYVQTVASAYYGPRFDYNPVTLAPRGLLIEEQRVNLLLYSDQFDNAAWLKTNTTVTANATTSPDGTINADKLIGTTTAAGHQCQQTAVAAATLGTTYTFSVYIKAAEYGFAFVGLNGTAFVAVPYISVNLSTGAVATTNGSPVSSSAVSAGNGWFRVTITGTTDVAASVVSPDVRPSPDGVWANRNTAQSGTSGIFLWGAQTEAATFATSYIPTVASTVTRAADVAVMTGTNFSSWYNQSEGTVVVDCNQVVGANSTSIAYTISDNTFNNSQYGVYTGGNSFRGANYLVGGVSQVAEITTFSVANVAVPLKDAFAYAVNNFGESLNGQTTRTDSSGVVNTASNRMYIGSSWSGTGNYLNGHIRTLTYYPQRLADAQLQALTA